MKTTTTRWVAALLLVCAGAVGAEGIEAEPGRVWVLDPKLPEAINGELEEKILREIEVSLEEALRDEAKLRLNMASGAFVLKGSAATKDKAVELIEKLKAGVVLDLAATQERIMGSKADRRWGQPINIRLQVVVASRKEGTAGAVLPALEKSLGESLGFKSFRLAAESSVASLVDEQSEMQTEIPWAENRRMGVSFGFHPSLDRAGRPTIKADLKVFETTEKPLVPPLKANIKTTYRPQVGLPTVVGASPLSETEALVFVVHHQGPGIE